MRTSQLNVGTSTDVSLKIAETDLSLLAATIRAPSGNEEPCLLKRLPNRHIGVQGQGDTMGTQGHADGGTGELAHGHMRGGCGTWGLVGTGNSGAVWSQGWVALWRWVCRGLVAMSGDLDGDQGLTEGLVAVAREWGSTWLVAMVVCDCCVLPRHLIHTQGGGRARGECAEERAARHQQPLQDPGGTVRDW